MAEKNLKLDFDFRSKYMEHMRKAYRKLIIHRLREIRSSIVASGEPLLDWDDIEREVAERRGTSK